MLFQKKNSTFSENINAERNEILPQKIRFKKRSSIIRSINSVPPLIISIPDEKPSFSSIIPNNTLLSSNLYPRTIIKNDLQFKNNSSTYLGKRGDPFATMSDSSKVLCNLNFKHSRPREQIIKIKKKNSCIKIKRIDFENIYNCSSNSEISNINIKHRKCSRTKSLTISNQIMNISDNLSFNSLTKKSDMGNNLMFNINF